MRKAFTLRQNFTKWLVSFLLFAFFSFFLVPRLMASTHYPDQDVCEIVTKEAEEAFDLPSGILSSIAQVESGRKTKNGDYKAWPWTINDNGKGLFFDNRQSANKYISKQKKLNNTQIDIGCMQISVKWHAQSFSSPESMLDPHANIAYAAIFLEELYQTHGNWELAIKYYHSAEKDKNEPYLQKVNAVWKDAPQPFIEPATASASIIAVENEKQDEPTNAISESKTNVINKAKTVSFETSNPKPIMGLANRKDSNLIASQEKQESKPSERFTQTQPYLANEWQKVVHFRRLFASE